MDITLITYSRLLKALQNSGYSFQTFVDFINNPKDKVVVMRHDVDRLPGNAFKMAGIEHGGVPTQLFHPAGGVKIEGLGD